jgi:hypothetical protein
MSRYSYKLYPSLNEYVIIDEYEGEVYEFLHRPKRYPEANEFVIIDDPSSTDIIMSSGGMIYRLRFKSDIKSFNKYISRKIKKQEKIAANLYMRMANM